MGVHFQYHNTVYSRASMLLTRPSDIRTTNLKSKRHLQQIVLGLAMSDQEQMHWTICSRMPTALAFVQCHESHECFEVECSQGKAKKLWEGCAMAVRWKKNLVESSSQSDLSKKESDRMIITTKLGLRGTASRTSAFVNFGLWRCRKRKAIRSMHVGNAC